MRLIICFTLITLLTSCAAFMPNDYTRTVASWRGGNASLLTKRWGTPSMKIASLEGDTIYIYKTISYKKTSAVLTSHSPDRGLPVSCVAAFTINHKNIITNTEVKGNGCYANENFVKLKSNPHNVQIR